LPKVNEIDEDQDITELGGKIEAVRVELNWLNSKKITILKQCFTTI
jgi:hypothetical protein